jgi:tRNA-2-methylthio-N6-dimethylallyladenosine synthase
MTGCNNFCSYCIVPYVRGREASRSPADITASIRQLAGQNVREITLLGQNVNAYRWDAGAAVDFASLIPLVAGAVEGTPVRWVRFLSSHPKDMTGAIMQALSRAPCFCRHIHLPVQHGSNRILRAMNRRYTREDYLALIRNLRAALPGLTLSTDILVGFPGETEEDMADLAALMDEARFLYAYTYHYNPREGTAAYNLPGRISDEVKKARLARVIEAQAGYTVDCLRQRLGYRAAVLIEGVSRHDAGELLGRTEHDEQVVVKADGVNTGDFIEVTLDSLSGNTFRASCVVRL